MYNDIFLTIKSKGYNDDEIITILNQLVLKVKSKFGISVSEVKYFESFHLGYSDESKILNKTGYATIEELFVDMETTLYNMSNQLDKK